MVRIRLFDRGDVPLGHSRDVFFSMCILNVSVGFESMRYDFTGVLYGQGIRFFGRLASVDFYLVPRFYVASMFLSIIQVPFEGIVNCILFCAGGLRTMLYGYSAIFRFFCRLIESCSRVAFKSHRLACAYRAVRFPKVLVARRDKYFTMAGERVAVTILFYFMCVMLR